MMKGSKILGLAFNTTIDRTDYEVGVAVNMELNKK